MNRDISNRADMIDSRDIVARIVELENERDDYTLDVEDVEDAHDATNITDADRRAAGVDANEDDAAELDALLALQEEASSSPDWPHGESLIRDSYFRTYAQDLAEDIGALPKDHSWPASYIDWEAAADALKQDYMSVDYDGVEYWIRA